MSALNRSLTRGLIALATLVVLTVLISLAGCASSRGLSSSASLSAPTAYAMSQTLEDAAVRVDAWPAADWWTVLGDPELDALMSEALKDSPTLKAAAARTRLAAAQAGVADASRFPVLAADGNALRERFPGQSIIPPPYAGQWNTYSDLQATLSWDVDPWGKNRANYAAAVNDRRAAAADAYASRLALSSSVAHAYVELERIYRQLDVARASLAQREQIRALTQQRNAAGLDSRLELRQTETALPVRREEIAQLEEQAQRTRNALAALLGQGPDRGRAIARPAGATIRDVAVPANLPLELIGRRPDIVAHRWQVEAAARRIDAARADFYPNVNLAAFAGFQLLGTSALLGAQNRELGAGPAVSLPLFDAGRRRSSLAARDAEYDVAVEQYNQSIADALRDVADQLAAARSVATQRHEESLALGTAQDAYDLAVLRYREGIGNYLQVLATESELLRQQSLDVDLRARALATAIDLARALGGGYDMKAAPTAPSAL